MRPYEIVVIFDATLDEGVISGVTDRIASFVTEKGGNPGHIERWGRRTFAYEIAHRTEGYYVLIEVVAEPPVVAEVDRMLALSDDVLRHRVIRQPEQATSAPKEATSRDARVSGESGDGLVERESAMAYDNTVVLVGNVTRDPELRFTPTGQATTSFGLAVNRRWQNRQTQEWEEQVSFLDVVCWREMAENVSESVGRGSRVIVTGRIEQRSWETPDGDKRSRIEVIADEIGPSLRWATAQIVKNERRGPAGNGPSNAPPPAAAAAQPAAAPAEASYSADEEPF